MSNKKSINRLGFLDLEIRDTNNDVLFKFKGMNLGKGIRHFEKFLDEKFGIKGFSAHDFEGWPKKRK